MPDGKAIIKGGEFVPTNSDFTYNRTVLQEHLRQDLLL